MLEVKLEGHALRQAARIDRVEQFECAGDVAAAALQSRRVDRHPRMFPGQRQCGPQRRLGLLEPVRLFEYVGQFASRIHLVRVERQRFLEGFDRCSGLQSLVQQHAQVRPGKRMLGRALEDRAVVRLGRLELAERLAGQTGVQLRVDITGIALDERFEIRQRGIGTFGQGMGDAAVEARCAQARRTVQRAPVGFERGFQAAHGSPQVPEVVGRDR